MTKPKITTEDFMTALEKVVAEQGEDFVYTPLFAPASPQCYYRHYGKPGCIVGHALEELGVPYDTTWDNHPGGLRASALLRDFTDSEPGVIAAATSAQHVQDSGNTWGEALSSARDVVAKSTESVVQL